MSDLKLCPYLPHQTERLLPVTHNKEIVTKFRPCLRSDCAAYLDGRCMYGGANIPVRKEAPRW